MDLYLYLLIWVCIIGLCLGSFFNVVILRSISGESIVFPPSKCPKCNHKLYFWHNIPVLSYILLRGKCYFCKGKISIQYPIIELTTMLLFGLTFLRFGINSLTVFVLFWCSCLLIMTVTDIKEKLVDCNIAILMAISGLIYWFTVAGWKGLWFSILGMLVGAIILEIIARLGYLTAGSRAMGEGDSYVAGALGAIGGLHGILPILLYSLIASMIFIIPVFLYNRLKTGDIRTVFLSVLFLISIAVYKLVPENWISFFALAITGILLAVSVLKNIKSTENRHYLPYVPALTIGILYFLFI